MFPAILSFASVGNHVLCFDVAGAVDEFYHDQVRPCVVGGVAAFNVLRSEIT